MPTTVWADIAIDFIEGFPRINGKSVILAVVDRFSKTAHFLPLGHLYRATTVVCTFFDNVGVLSSIVSDHDPIFTGHFWWELFSLAGIKLLMSSVFHPQSDGQSESANKIITMYLRCLLGEQSRGSGCNGSHGGVLLQLVAQDIAVPGSLRSWPTVLAHLCSGGSMLAGGPQSTTGAKRVPHGDT
jgi:hypothetical protein